MRRRDVLATGVATAIVRPARAITPIVETRSGRVRGVRHDGIHVFKGIPYGEDTSRHRFRPAPPRRAWSGIRDAVAYGPACPQRHAATPVSEDCLFLNVWTPGLDASHRPVMVYIHGGEFSSGSGSEPLYDGTRLSARGDVVVVTVNHRLAALGHLFLGTRAGGTSFPGSGNTGLTDLILALTWVRDNIARFGGDPDCITVFGQSGGGAKIATLMAMPAAQGLFHRAATMSGQQITASGPAAAAARTRVFFEALGQEADGIASVPLDRLVKALDAPDPTHKSSVLYWGPVLDGDTLPRHPFYPDAAPQSLRVPMMIGNTRDETRAFFRADSEVAALTWESLVRRLERDMRVDIDANLVLRTYRKWRPEASPTDLFYTITTASRSWRGAIIEAEQRALAGAPAYVYQLDWRSPADGYVAAHALDVPLVFGTTDVEGAISGNGEAAQGLSAMMSDAFIAFARTGDPNCSRLPAWPPYTIGKRETMLFDLPPSIALDPRGEERRLFETVPFIQRGTL